jgi:formate dehydrogenase subunit delta
VSLNAPGEIRLVNKIAVHFRHLPDDQAAAAVADHVRKFWDPRMKKRLLDLVGVGGNDLEPVAVAAAALLR